MPVVQEEILDKWDADFWRKAPYFEPLKNIATQFAHFPDWPSLEDYSSFSSWQSEEHSLRFVEQASKQKVLDYIQQIHCASEVPSRAGNWHDYLNMLCWQTFPQTRMAINGLQVDALKRQNHVERGRVRTAQLDMLTHLDECGVVVLSSAKDILDGIRTFSWQKIFVEERAAFSNAVDVFIFGHGLYTQCLDPFIGLTGRCILLECAPAFFTKPIKARVRQADARLAQHLVCPQAPKSPKELAPLPLLGVPGWYAGNQDSHFYENQNYFRSGRQKVDE